MKKYLITLMILVLLVSLSACNRQEVEEAKIKSLELNTMRTVARLSTIESYYHIVAKYFEDDASGFWLWKKDRHFWIEYSGTVKVGVDISRLEFSVKDNVVRIEIPPAQVTETNVDMDSLTKESYIVAQDSAKVEAKHQTMAFEAANSQLEKAAREDRDLLIRAQERAKILIEQYVKNIGTLNSKEYKIEWVYLDNSYEESEKEDVEQVETKDEKKD